VLAVLRQRNFVLLWLSGLVSLTGDRAMRIALPVYVYQQTGSTLATAGMAATYYLPAVVLGSVAGVFADRWDRRQIMIATNLIQATVMLLLLLVRSNGWLWLVYVVSLVDTSVATFFQPAESAIVPNLVDEEHLIPANSLGSLNNTIARIAGPPIGGTLIGLFGIGSVAIFNGASFLIAAGLVALILAPSRSAPAASEVAEVVVSSWVRVWREWRAGLTFVRRDRLVVSLFIVLSVTSFGGAMIDPLFSPFVLSVLGRGPATIGWILTTFSIGGLLAGFLVGWFGSKVRPRQLVSFGTILTGMLMVAMYNQKSLAPVVVLGFLMYLPVVAAGVGADTMLQTGIPDAFRGRVYGALSTTNGLLCLGSVGVSGVLSQYVGIVPMLTTAGCVTVLAGTLALVLIPRAERRDDSAHRDQAAVAHG